MSAAPADRHLREASIHVYEGRSLVVPVIIEGLPDEITALGCSWQRKREFHLTAASTPLIERAGDGLPDLWDTVTRTASNRSVGRLAVTDEVRRVTTPENRDLQTLIVMVDAPGFEELYRDLSQALGVSMRPPPAHVTLYSTHPAHGIGLDDEVELEERAPALSEQQQDEIRAAMAFESVFGATGARASRAARSPG